MKIGLAFSGGKDSMACLYLLKDRGLLDKTAVIWVNTGKNYPELLQTVEKARELCTQFIEVISDRDAQNSEMGVPTEVVPINRTRLGMLIAGQSSPHMVQSYLDCCWANISWPLQMKAKELGLTHLVRGQRIDESFKSPARNGTVVDGIVYVQPIEHWSREQVMEYLRTKMEIPDHYALNHSSMDCYDCTGFMEASEDRIAFMQKKHPNLYAEYSVRLETVKAALRGSIEALYGK